MSKCWMVMIAAVLLLGSAMGCSKAGEVKTYTAAEQQIVVSVGGTFVIELKTSPTTGYDWEYTGTSGWVQLLEKTYKADNTGLVGSGGTDTFKFKAQSKGTATLVFVYKRSWETTIADQKTFTIEVN
jgi:inhibitor of cysteine peptidase